MNEDDDAMTNSSMWIGGMHAMIDHIQYSITYTDEFSSDSVTTETIHRSLSPESQVFENSPSLLRSDDAERVVSLLGNLNRADNVTPQSHDNTQSVNVDPGSINVESNEEPLGDTVPNIPESRNASDSHDDVEIEATQADSDDMEYVGDSSQDIRYDEESHVDYSHLPLVNLVHVASQPDGVATASDSSDSTNNNNNIDAAVISDNMSNTEDSNSTPDELPDLQLSKSRRSDTPPQGPPAKVRKVESDDNDGETCPICLEMWGDSLEHRLVSLKCGHLFGLNCVERWLKALPVKSRTCPTCKSKAAIKDFRYIYPRKLVAPDISQIAELQEQLTSERSERKKLELELEKQKIAFRTCQLERDFLRKTLMKTPKYCEPIRKQWRFSLEKNLQICREGGCRVLTYNCRTSELYVSQKSTNNLFPGYGIRKVSCVDYKLGQFVHLHPKPIRDITYSQQRDLLLSVGLDSTARIVERGIPSITINAGMPLWSCSWDILRTNEFYVGGVGGVIHQYDFRNPSTYIQMLRNTSDISPVASLCSTEFGLLSCQLNSSWLWVANQRQWEPRSLPVDGSFMSLCYDNESHRAVLCTRPNASTLEKAKLTVCKLKSGLQGDVTVDVEETFNGSARSSLMSRATWVKVPGASWVGSHSESDSALFLHGLDGSRTITLHAAEPAIDVCSLQLNGNTLLAALSESRLRIYKALASS